MPRPHRPVLDRALEKIRYDAGCWLWTGALNATGYGVIARKDGDGIGTTRLAHRAVYEALVGPVADDEVIDHLCRNPACCNPLHMEPVTNEENLARGAPGGSAWQKAKTHCPSGHAYTPGNTRLKQPGNRRECRQCGRDYYHRMKAGA